MAATYILGPFRLDAETDTLIPWRQARFAGPPCRRIAARARGATGYTGFQGRTPDSFGANLPWWNGISRPSQGREKQRRRPFRGRSEPGADAAKSTPVSRPDWQLQSRLRTRTRVGCPPGIAPASAQGAHRAASHVEVIRPSAVRFHSQTRRVLFRGLWGGATERGAVSASVLKHFGLWGCGSSVMVVMTCSPEVVPSCHLTHFHRTLR